MRSAEAAKNTSAMIEEAVKNAGHGVGIVEEVTTVLDEIVNGITKTSNLVGEIAAASQEQSQGVEQVNTAVTHLDKITQENAAVAEQSASASQELKTQATQMNKIVDQLASMVGGSVNTAAPTSKGHKLSLSDQTFHQITNQSEDSPSEIENVCS